MNVRFRGEKNGKRTGMKLNIAASGAEKINEKYKPNFSTSTIQRIPNF